MRHCLVVHIGSERTTSVGFLGTQPDMPELWKRIRPVALRLAQGEEVSFDIVETHDTEAGIDVEGVLSRVLGCDHSAGRSESYCPTTFE